MARPDPATPLLVPSEARRGRDSAADGDRPRLRLVVARGQLALELDAPFALDPLTIEALSASLPDVRFPVELSGGAAAFRHKRGRLEQLALRLPHRAVHRFCRPRLEGVLPGRLWHHSIAPIEDGWLVGLASDGAALAFELYLAPLDGDLRLLIEQARGVGIGAPPQMLAARAVAAVFKPFGVTAGAALVLEAPLRELMRALTPLAGMRVPDVRGMRWTRAGADVEATVLCASRDEAPHAPSPRVIRAVETAALIAEAEDALWTGQLEAARSAYLAALTRAPRHVEITRRLAALDAAVGGRQEAALATLGDALPAVEAGPLGASLLSLVGDVAGARAAWRRAAGEEPYGPLAALCWLELAALSVDPHDAAEPLDRAVARAPGATAPRWQRFALALRLGQRDTWRADIEHLVAIADSAHERHRVLRRAAEALLEQRALDDAAELFERALRYTPDSVDAVAGLGRALARMGHERRALELWSRAAALAERSGRPLPHITIEMAIGLAEIADDRPAAIARVSRIDAFSAEVFRARGLEARWRAELGDLSGASHALGQLAGAVEAALGVLTSDDPAPAAAQPPALWGGDASPYASREDARHAIAALLLEGARIHEIDRRDLHAARRLLALALRLHPRSGAIKSAFRRVAGAVDARGAAPALAEVPSSDAPTPRLELPREPLGPMSITLGEAGIGAAAGDDDDEVLADALADKLRADPGDAATARRLAEVLERLGRDHELLALLSARVDETAGSERADWLSRREAVLRRLIAAAQAAGREDEAQLYALMLGRGGPG